MGCGCGRDRIQRIAESLPRKALPQKQPEGPPSPPGPVGGGMSPHDIRRARRAARRGVPFPAVPVVPVVSQEQPSEQPQEQPAEVIPPGPLRHLHIQWPHGLGDSAVGALLVPIYLRHGVQIVVSPTQYSQCLWERAGAIIRPGGVHHPYRHGPGNTNKIRYNLGREPLPGLPGVDLWAEIQRAEPLSLIDHVTEDGRKLVDDLPQAGRKLVVCHWQGHTLSTAKDIPADVADAVRVRLLIEGLQPVVIGGEFKPDLPTLWYLLSRAAAVVAIDSGVQLLATHWTDRPVVGVWTEHRPESFAVPGRAVHIARRGGRNGEYRVVEYSGVMPSADLIVSQALSLIRTGGV